MKPESTVVSFYSSTPTISQEKPEESDIPDRSWSLFKKSSDTTDELTMLQRIFALIRSSA